MTDRNIVDLAHAVLDAVVPDVPWKIQLQEFQARAAAAPTLARAVIDLTAKLDAERFAHANTAVKVKGAEALADRLSAEAADDFDGASGTSVSLVKYETAKAIRAALNGETND